MLPSIDFPSESGRHQRSPSTLAIWSAWLRAMLAMLVLLTASSSAWAAQACVLNWTPTPAQLSGGSYRYTLLQGDTDRCDPTLEGLYTSQGGSTGDIFAGDNSKLGVDLSIFPKDTLVFTPSPNTGTSSWSFTLWQSDGVTSVLVTIQLPLATPPTLSNVAPNAGPTAGGQTVTLTGTGFTGATDVRFGGSPASSYTVNSSTQITATAPPSAAGTVDVTVTTPGGTSATSANDQFTYAGIPAISAISPNAGPTTGGSTVTLVGTNFIPGATTVTFGGAAATGVTVSSPTSLTATTPAHAAGPVMIVVSTAGGTASVPAAFSYTTVPAVSSIAPAAGPGTGGTSVVVTGTGFTGATAVTFGGNAATGFTVNSDTQITATAPAGSGVVDIRVTTTGGTSAANSADQFTYAGAPAVTGVTPNNGPTTGGTAVTITGTGFTGATSVRFGANAAGSFTVVSATQITATAPASAAGTVDVTVTTPGGTSTTSAADQFTYLPPPAVTSISPGTGPGAGGTSVTISGTGFTGVTAVMFGATAATSFTFNSATSITATSPAGTGTVDIRVTTAGGTSPTNAADQFTYIGAPTVTGLSPKSGPGLGGTSVTISGTGFTGVTAVTFGATAATTFAVNSATSITATTPAGTGTVDVRVTTAGGTSAIGANDQFIYAGVPAISAISPNAGPTAGGSTVTLIGTNFIPGATTVTFGGAAATGVTVSSPTSLTATTPAHAAGPVMIVVSTAGGSASVPAAFSYTTVPAVSSIAPAAGPGTGGTSVVVTGTGFTGATAVTFGGNAATGFTVNSDTQITATAPAGSGVVDIRVTTTGGTSAANSADQFTYAGAPAVTGVTPNNGLTTGGTAVTITGTGFTGATSVRFGANAAGSVTVVSATQITATAPAGTAGVTNITVTTPGGTSATSAANQYLYTAPPSISFVTTTLPGSVAGTASYSQQIQVSGGAAPYQFSIVSGSVPTGLTFDPSGSITGKATAVGTFTFAVQAKDANNLTATQSLSIQVTPPVLSIDTTALANGVVGVAYSQAFAGSGGVSPYTFAVTGTLPAGLTFANGTIGGTPTQTGTFNLTIRMADTTTGSGAPYSTTKTLVLTVGASAMAIAPATLPTPVAGLAYSQTITASGGTAPYRFTVTNGALPAGLSLNQTTGLLAGTPSATGTSTFTISATDASTGPGTPITASQNYTFNISNQAASAPPVQAKVLSNTSLTIRATANAVGGPFTRVAIVTPPASGTAVVNGEDIVYTPAAITNGVVTFAYALTNAIGTSAPIAVTVTVAAVPVTTPGLQASVSANEPTNIDITAGATGGPFTNAGILSMTPPNAGTASIVAVTPAAPASAGGAGLLQAAIALPTQYSVRFVPAAAFAGTAVITYTLSNENATSAPGTLQVSVAPRKDPTTDPDVTGLIGAQVEAARRFATAQIGNYNQRLEALHGTGRAPSRNGMNVVLPSPERDRNVSRCQDVGSISERDACLRGDMSRLAQGKAGGLDVRDKSVGAGGAGTGNGNAPDLPGVAAGEDQRFAYWTAGTVDFGFADMAAQRSGFRFTTGGVTLGADYRFSDTFSLGAGVGYGHDSTDIGSAGTRNTGDSYSGALYASFRPIPTLFVDAVTGFGSLNFNSRRWVIDSSDFASGKRSGQQFFGSVSAGYEYRDNDWLFSPYGRLTASRSTLDQYSETGAGLNALTYFKQNVNTVSGTLGMRAGFAKATRIGTFSPNIRVELQHDFNGQSMAGLAYADIAGNGPMYFVPGRVFGSDRVQFGFGTKLRTGVLVFGLDYSVTTGMGGLQQGLRLTFAAPF